MNIGARIQSLRKAQEMSQEDLASLLSVSRQTVSQWETDQTVPSLDNIYRLKEIFGVSFDGLLSEKEETQPAAGEYKEEFSVTYSPEDIKKANRLIYSKNIKVAIISLFVYYFLLNFLITAEAPDALPGMVCGILFVSVIRWIVQLINVKKAQKRSIMQTSRKIYGYTVTRNVLTVSVSENRELNSQYRIKKGDISLVWENKKYIVFAYSGQLFILNKEKVPQSILLGEFLYSAKKINTASTRDKTVSNILVALSVLSLFFALYASIGGVAERNLDMQRYGLSFFLFAPLPIASIIFGYSQRRKGIPNKKNIVVGIIMTVLLCIYGSLFFVVSDMISYDYAVIEQYEAELGIDLPESGMATIQDFSDTVKEENSNEFIYSMCQVEYSADEAAELRRNILKDDRWLKKVPAEILGCTPFGTYTGYDHFLLYNADLKQFNSLPPESGTYRFIFIAFSEQGSMLIYEYDKALTVGLPGDEGFYFQLHRVVQWKYQNDDFIPSKSESIAAELFYPTNSDIVVTKRGYIEENGVFKGMGSAFGGKWKPKKPEDERFIGEPGEIKVTIIATKKGTYTVYTKIGEDGRAVRERHFTDHGRPDLHSDPHDQIVDWTNGVPNLNFAPIINYFDGNVPEFKSYKEMLDLNVIEYDSEIKKFTSISDFKQCMWQGGEVQFEWKNKAYSIVWVGKQIVIGEGHYIDDNGISRNIADDEIVETDLANFFDTSDEALEYIVGGDRLRDIITLVEVTDRTI